MGKLIAIVGVSGVGKTSLVKALSAAGDFATGFEQHAERPFQSLFDQDKRFALHNQIDYFILRAEQERILRADPRPALIDGGLDVDFHGFARLFHQRGYLSDAEFDLCKRLYQQLRAALPLPAVIVHLVASPDVIRVRLADRDRVNIATSADTLLLDQYLHDWLRNISTESIIRLDSTNDDRGYTALLPQLQKALKMREVEY